ncbi:hypothetical protein [Mangrovicoccus sp. HB161399]|uniref:hypothetical protein n=1 Tax=Mangrovicoccus sp. HB161399 TaxID=2720392 RepID=UPI001554D7F9|nr:hypothetical protein [Mangrovicoccus sp. HB161399]
MQNGFYGLALVLTSALCAPDPGIAASAYWNLFNIEGENAIDSAYVTYGSLEDMLTDSNRTGQFSPDTTGAAARNVVGSGGFFVPTMPPVPVPVPALLLASALGWLVVVRRRFVDL